MANYAQLAKKLQTAINQRAGAKLVINTQQWYSQDRKRPITIYIVRQVFSDPNTSHKKSIQLFRTYSQIQMLLFLRDFWYDLNGWEIPTDNQMWEELKKRYGQEEEPIE